MRLTPLLPAVILTLSSAVSTAQTMPAGSPQTRFRDSAVTLYGGFRDGGDFTDATTNQTLRLDGSSAWAISYDKGLDGSRQLEFYLSYQSTHLELEPSAVATAAVAVPSSLPMKVIYLHLGGTNFVDGPIGEGPYVLGGLGATLFLPESSLPGSSGHSDEVRPSLNLGFGYQTALSRELALRFEARGYATAIYSSGGLFCSGGCVLKIKADAVFQGEVQLGLSYLF